MNYISFSEYKKFGADDIEDLLPLMITVEGQEAFLIDKPENIIVVSDLHPRVRTMLKAQEKRARTGMPKPGKIFKSNKISQESSTGKILIAEMK